MSNSGSKTSKTTSRSINLGVERIQGKPFYVNREGIKEGMRGRLQNPVDIISTMSKGNARKLRKSLRKAGFSMFASLPRFTSNNLEK